MNETSMAEFMGSDHDQYLYYPSFEMYETNKQPPLKQVISAMSGVQLHPYYTASIDLIHTAFNKWAGNVLHPKMPSHRIS